jgi:hypothetical protein
MPGRGIPLAPIQKELKTFSHICVTTPYLVRTSLEQQVAIDNDSSSMSASGVMQELIDYSMGFKPRSAVMAELGLDDYGLLLRLLNAAGLPHPIVPIAKRKAMVAEMTAAIQGLQ